MAGICYVTPSKRPLRQTPNNIFPRFHCLSRAYSVITSHDPFHPPHIVGFHVRLDYTHNYHCNNDSTLTRDALTVGAC
jgi:tRNA U38,U39,U40 pseudouridine synthase TruA